MALGHFKEASDLFLRSSTLIGEHHISWFNRGVCEMRQRHITEAKYCFYRVVIGRMSDW